MTLLPTILNQTQLDKDGNREIRIGDFHFAHRGVAGRDIPCGASNLSYLRSAWPKVEARFPRPSFTPAISLTTTLGSGGSRRICAGNSGVVIAVGQIANSSTAVYRSTNYGASWAAVTSTATVSYTSTIIQDLKYNPTTGTFLVVRASATGTYSIDRTIDNGTTWTQVRTAALTNAQTGGQCMAVTWVTGSTWVAVIRSNAAAQQVISYKSTDDGVTWTAGTQTSLSNAGTGHPAEQVRVGYTGTTYYLFYLATNTVDQVYNGYFTSTDGLVWTQRFSTFGEPVSYGGRLGQMFPLENGEMGLQYAVTNVSNGYVGIARLKPTAPTSGAGTEIYFYALTAGAANGQLGFAFKVGDGQIISLNCNGTYAGQFTRYYRYENANPAVVYNYESFYTPAGAVTNSVAASNCVWSSLAAPEWTFCVDLENTKVYAYKDNGAIYTIDLTVGANMFEVPWGALGNYTNSPFASFNTSEWGNKVQMQVFLRGA